MNHFDGHKMDGRPDEQNEMDAVESDPQVAMALKHFRDSVHAWSEEELARSFQRNALPRKRSYLAMHLPVLSWAASAVLVIGAVSIPVTHEYRDRQQKQAAFVLEQKRIANEAAERQRAYAIDDEQLLRNVDSDVAQETPDAMEPLASLMTESSATKK